MNHGYQPKTGDRAPLSTPSGGSAGSKEPRVRYLGDIQKLSLAPNDILVLSLDRPVPIELAMRLREMVRKVAGDDRKVMILEPGMKVGVLEQAS